MGASASKVGTVMSHQAYALKQYIHIIACGT
jgi:hypothetical protein